MNNLGEIKGVPVKKHRKDNIAPFADRSWAKESRKSKTRTLIMRNLKWAIRFMPKLGDSVTLYGRGVVNSTVCRAIRAKYAQPSLTSAI